MAKKKFVEEITSMEEDFGRWYTDVVKKAGLIDYSSVRGCMILKPYGYAIWENLQRKLDKRFKKKGIQNVYMPMFIPESLLQKEKDHVEGFAPEVAWVTHGGQEKLAEKLCIRPTSETLFCELYAREVKSYRDLPKLYNQWCSVVRWEKTTRPFLRSLEFLWQEGHTVHATEEDAKRTTIDMLNIYADFSSEVLAIPMIKGQKTEKEKFAGARETYTIESLMHDGKALQSGTTHHFGDGFARAFDIQYLDENNEQVYAWQTSWGVSTRLVGAIIMVHGDNRGLVLPPEIAPVKAVIVPVAMHKEGVLEKAKEVKEMLGGSMEVLLDDTDKKPGWKFNEYEMMGVPLRIELGPKDMEKGQVILVRRDNGQKIIVPAAGISDRVQKVLRDIQKSLYEKALNHRNENTFSVAGFEELAEKIEARPGFFKAMWCKDMECEEKIREQTGATIRCVPFEQEKLSDKCLCCGKEAGAMVYLAKTY